MDEYEFVYVNVDAYVDEDDDVYDARCVHGDVYANVDVYESSIVCTASLSSPDFAGTGAGSSSRLTRGRPLRLS